MKLTTSKLVGMTRRDFFKGSGAAAVALGAGGAALGRSPYAMAQQVSGGGTVHEATRDIKVFREADVVVVGGGPGGVGAAVAAARAGANTVLIERSGTWAAWAPAGWSQLFRT